jgi:hypothetical protein
MTMVTRCGTLPGASAVSAHRTARPAAPARLGILAEVSLAGSWFDREGVDAILDIPFKVRGQP